VTDPGPTTNITAESESTVGIQAEQVNNCTVYSTAVHTSTVYQLPPDASPRKKYEVGVRYLEDGVPRRARDLIENAIAHGYEDGGEVRFHWVLAMLSKRSYRDLTFEERQRLERTATFLNSYPDNEWKRALEAICELLGYLNDPGVDPGLALTKLQALQSYQYDAIVRHLDLVLAGSLKDSLWAETRRKARETQFSNNRLNRVWAYFAPDPARPRVRKPAENSATAGDWFRAVTATGLFLIAVGVLGRSVLAHATPLPILAYLLALLAGYLGSRHGLEWRYQTVRLNAKDRDYFGPRRVNRASEAGFANRVDHAFMHYFNKFVPSETDRAVWLTETAGIRNSLRDEIVDLYRESRTSADEVRWLIRYLVLDVNKRWKNGTLWEYREQYRTTPSTKVWCSLSLAALAPAAVCVIVAAIQAAPLTAAIATLLALVSGRAATVRWLHIISERRRLAEDRREYERLLAARLADYQRWKEKLSSIRPSESEMETWLNSDKTMLLDKALRRYRLAWRDIITHAFLQTPAERCKRAQVSRGPWRYSKYDIHLFLITHNGVREVSTEHDFENALFNDKERTEFRFDAVSSVHVRKTGEFGYTLGLTLMNGPTRKIRITEPEATQPNPSESPVTFSEIDLDATGFTHTLHILEGISAEGKSWTNRHSYANGDPDSTTSNDSRTMTSDASTAPTVRIQDSAASRNRKLYK
jgi:hypothetical protein